MSVFVEKKHKSTRGNTKNNKKCSLFKIIVLHLQRKMRIVSGGFCTKLLRNRQLISFIIMTRALFLSYKSGKVVSRVVLMLLAFLVVSSIPAIAQEQQTEDTHAHSASKKWKGIDKNTVIGNSQYDPILVDGKYTGGKTIFLYNVGTGRFIIEGGNWGMEGRLFHEDFGRPLYLFSDGFITSGIQENGEKYLFGCNVPSVFHTQSTWTNWNQYSFTVMMDADKSKRNKGWQFERVETDENADTYTYYMYEEKNNNRYYLGAAWGECHAEGWKDDFGNSRDSGDGKEYVLMDYDRACWTSKSNPYPCGDMTKKEVNGDMITIDELYQWRIVSEEDFIDALNKEEVGLNPSISIFVPDRDFTRNANNFDTNWVMEPKSDGDYSETGRFGYTYGEYLNKQNQQQYNNAQNNNDSKYFDNDAWNMPIRLKNVFDNSSVAGGNLAYGWENAKNGFLTFEGVGRTYTQFTVPKPGWYQVQCYGFVRSDKGHDAYLFAKVVGGEGSAYGGEAKNNLVTVPANKFKYKNNNNVFKDKRDSCLVVGNLLRKPKTKEPYKNTVWICVTDAEFESGYTTLQVGVGKDEATKSSGSKKNGKYYYYDTDWVCIDDIRVSYLGTSPAFFYEEEESLEYLIPDPNNTKQFESSSPSNYGASEGQYGGAVCIERSLKTNQWNSFSFPMPVTGEQMRHAFGEDAQLARIDGIGTMSGNPNVIDFKKVSLRTTDAVVEPGHFYMLKPTQAPTTGIDPQGNNTTFYELGRFFFTVNENEPATYTPGRMNLSKKMDDETQVIKSLTGESVGKAGVNYVKTPGFESYHAGDEAEGIYAPKGSYVVSDNNIVHLNKDTRIKGFRGWIDLSEGEGGSSKEYSMDVFGMFEEPVGGGSTGLPRIQLFSADESVYDLFGRKVGTLGTKLPKGIYIVKGKKFLVK